MNIAGQRRPACVTRLNCEFRGALVTVNRRWPPSVCFLQHTSTRQGSGTAHPAARLARRWDRDPQLRFNGGQCRRRRRPICRGHRGGFRSCVRATVEKAAWCSRSPTARCTTRPPCFLSETFFGYSPIGSRSAAHPRTLEASLIVRWAGTHSAMSPSGVDPVSWTVNCFRDPLTKRDRTVALGSTIVGEAISRHPPARSGNAIRLSTTRAAHTRRASKARARAAGLASVRQWGTDDVSTSQWQSRRRAEQVAIRQVQTAVGQRSETTVCLAKGTDAALESQAQRPELWRRHHSVAAIEPADHNGVL